LEGTYDFCLTITPHGSLGAAWMQFYLADYIFLETGQYGRIALEGGFAIPGESIGALLRDFEKLLM